MDHSVAIEAVLDNLPVAELEQSLSDFISPFAAVLPDARLRQVVPLALRGIVAGESPVVTAMAQGVARSSSSSRSYGRWWPRSTTQRIRAYPSREN